MQSATEFDILFAKINNVPYFLGGIHGFLSTYQPPGQSRWIVEHHPSVLGRQSPQYRAVRDRLGDDWFTDLSLDLDELERVFAYTALPVPF